MRNKMWGFTTPLIATIFLVRPAYACSGCVGCQHCKHALYAITSMLVSFLSSGMRYLRESCPPPLPGMLHSMQPLARSDAEAWRACCSRDCMHACKAERLSDVAQLAVLRYAAALMTSATCCHCHLAAVTHPTCCILWLQTPCSIRHAHACGTAASVISPA